MEKKSQESEERENGDPSVGRATSKTVAKTVVFTVVMPGSVIVIIPLLLSMVPGTGLPAGPWWIVGIALLVPGVVLLTAAILSFVIEGGGTPMIYFAKATERVFGIEPDKLVKGGLYKYSRNPMYLGVVTCTAATGFFLSSWATLAWAAVVFLIFHLVVVKLEEPHLSRKHGDSYKEFMELTPRWIGSPGKLARERAASRLTGENIISSRLTKSTAVLACRLGFLRPDETKFLVRLNGKHHIDEVEHAEDRLAIAKKLVSLGLATPLDEE